MYVTKIEWQQRQNVVCHVFLSCSVMFGFLLSVLPIFQLDDSSNKYYNDIKYVQRLLCISSLLRPIHTLLAMNLKLNEVEDE